MKQSGVNYTKGEWKVTRWSSHNEIHVSADDGNNSNFVANCGHTGKDEVLPYNKEAIANANLISASPDMYEALKDALDLLDTQLKEYNESLSLLHRQKVGRGLIATKISKALAKAEGK